VAGLSAR